jgi:hypothetical protein
VPAGGAAVATPPMSNAALAATATVRVPDTVRARTLFLRMM